MHSRTLNCDRVNHVILVWVTAIKYYNIGTHAMRMYNTWFIIEWPTRIFTINHISIIIVSKNGRLFIIIIATHVVVILSRRKRVTCRLRSTIGIPRLNIEKNLSVIERRAAHPCRAMIFDIIMYRILRCHYPATRRRRVESPCTTHMDYPHRRWPDVCSLLY